MRDGISFRGFAVKPREVRAMKKTAFYFLTALCAAGLCAQESEEYADTRGPARELVFTANRTEESVAKTAALITVIDADEIASSGAQNVVQVLERTGGVTFGAGTGGAGSDTVSMRGFGENSFARVLVLVDGRRINNADMSAPNWNIISLADIERIEVLNGSAAVQYGNNAAAGVIHIITKKSGAERTALNFAGGSDFYNRVSAARFSPFEHGSFSLSAEHFGTRGYREHQGTQTTNLSASLSLELTDAFSLMFLSSFSDINNLFAGSLNKSEFLDNPRKGAYDDDGSERNWQASVSAEWKPSERLRITLPVSYTGAARESNMASWGSYSDSDVMTLEARPSFLYAFKSGEKSFRFSAGADFLGTTLSRTPYADKERRLPNDSGTAEAALWTAGPYVSASFEPVESLTLSAGARYDTAFMSAEVKDGSLNGSTVHTAFVYDAGAVFRPLQSIKLYAKYAAVFRYPLLDEQAQYSGYNNTFNAELRPERGFNAEAGFSLLNNERLALDANIYYMRMYDEIAYNAALMTNDNLDTTARVGGVLNLRVTPSEFIRIDASYSQTNAWFADGDNKDKNVPLVPKHVIYGALILKPVRGLSFGPDCEYASERFAGGDNANVQKSDRVKAYFIIGAKIRYEFSYDKNNLAFLLSARNLANVSYATNIYSNGYSAAYYPCDGRSITASLQYRF